MKKWISFLFAILMVVTPLIYWHSGSLVYAGSENIAEANSESLTETNADAKIFCEATLEDDFSDDTILFTITREATMRFEKLSVKNFPEIDCIEVRELTESTAEVVQKKQSESVCCSRRF